MDKMLRIKKCAKPDCRYCYDNEITVFCSKLKNMGLSFVFLRSEFDLFPKECPLENMPKI